MSNNIIVLSPNDLKSQYILTSKNREFSFFPKFMYNSYNCRIVIKRINKTYICNLLYPEWFTFEPKIKELSSTNLHELTEMIQQYWKPEIEKNTWFLLAWTSRDQDEDDLDLLDHNNINRVDIIMWILDSVNEKRNEFARETDLKKKLKLWLDFVDILEKERAFIWKWNVSDQTVIWDFLLNWYEKWISQLTSKELQLYNIGLKYWQTSWNELEKNFYIEKRQEIIWKILEKTKDKYDKRDMLLEYVNLINEQSSEWASFSINMKDYEEKTKELEKLELEIQKEVEEVYRWDKAVDSEFRKRMREKWFIETAWKPSERYWELYWQEEMEDIIEFLYDCYDWESQFMKLRDESQKEEFLQLCDKWWRTPWALRWIWKLLFTKTPFNTEMNHDKAYTIALINKREELWLWDKWLKIDWFIESLEEKLDKEEHWNKTERSIQEAIDSLKQLRWDAF